MERIKADVAVIGTGAAGMSAAVRAAEGGAKVVVFEKRAFPGGLIGQAEEALARTAEWRAAAAGFLKELQ